MPRVRSSGSPRSGARARNSSRQRRARLVRRSGPPYIRQPDNTLASTSLASPRHRSRFAVHHLEFGVRNSEFCILPSKFHLEISLEPNSVHRNTMPCSPKIIQLRKFLAERFPQQKVTHRLASTGWLPLDALLGGGLPKGSITQLIIPHISAGG